MPVARVYLVRHGETDANRQRIIQGQLDTLLNDAGLEQAQLTANALEHVPFVAAHSSDLSRAVKTAETILGKHPGVALQKHEGLRERYMGDMEGKTISAGARALTKTVESAAALDARADRWWTEHVVRYVQSVGAREAEAIEVANVLVVSHGGLMHVLLQGLLGSRKVRADGGVDVKRFRFPNASVSVVEMEGNGKGRLVLFADTTHLDVELVEGNVDVVEDNVDVVEDNVDVVEDNVDVVEDNGDEEKE